MRVLGIDASLRSTGSASWSRARGGPPPSSWGRSGIPPPDPTPSAFRRLHAEVTALLARARPDEAAIEGGFFFKNAKTAMVLGECRGVVIAACAAAGVPVFEYSPRLVKQALTGFGGAQKDQVAKMVMAILGLKEKPQEDAADALAIAICHLNSQTGIAALKPKPL